MHVGIIGTGPIGGTLARRLTALGHPVAIANSRGPASLAEFVETGATTGTAAQAARARDVVIVTVPQRAVRDLPRDLLASAVVIDASSDYLGLRDGTIPEIDAGLTDREWVARQRPMATTTNLEPLSHTGAVRP